MDILANLPKEIGREQIGVILDLDALLARKGATWVDACDGFIDTGLHGTVAALVKRLGFVAIVYTGSTASIAKLIGDPGKAILLGFNGLEVSRAGGSPVTMQGVRDWHSSASTVARLTDHLAGEPGVNICQDGVLRALRNLYPDPLDTWVGPRTPVLDVIRSVAGHAALTGMRVRQPGRDLILNEPPSKGETDLGGAISTFGPHGVPPAGMHLRLNQPPPKGYTPLADVVSTHLSPDVRTAIYIGELSVPGLPFLAKASRQVVWVQVARGPGPSFRFPGTGSLAVADHLIALAEQID